MSFAEKAFGFDIVKSAFEDSLLALLGEGGDYQSIGWDEYDHSLEIYGCCPNLRLSLEAQAFIYSEGFGRIYANHLDGYETHYFTAPTLEPSRVNYNKEATSASPNERTCENSELSSL